MRDFAWGLLFSGWAQARRSAEGVTTLVVTAALAASAYSTKPGAVTFEDLEALEERATARKGRAAEQKF